MAHQTAAGATLGISAAPPASHTISGFDTVSFITVGEVTNVGEFGKEFALVSHQPLNTRGTKKSKGSFNNGQLNPNLALDPSDGGQQAMEVALESDDPVYFIITLKTGTVFYLVGLVMSFKPSIGNADDVITASTTIELSPDEILKKVA
ncbi:hypothetical protein [Epibacterium ulvae]|uniref:hypothetical protein n=1 Tax=Epibacterium ulvae TaxID=1156985 RepID=UPI002490F173|nr:hypothetical protein [Epibacterium ulvae]